MATIKLCDWTKKRLGKNEDTHVVTIGDKEFEVGDEGREFLLKQLEGESAFGMQIATPPLRTLSPPKPKEPAPAPLQGAQPGGMQIQVTEEPFEPGPGSIPETPMASTPEPIAPEDMDPSDLLEIPDDPKRRFKIPSVKLAERIIDEATRFNEGSLPSLTMGAREQKDASKRLRVLEEKEEDKIRRRAGSDVNFNKRGF